MKTVAYEKFEQDICGRTKEVKQDKAKVLVLAKGKDVSLRDVTFANKYGVPFMATSGKGLLKGKGFALNTAKFNWALGKDNCGQVVLIPRKKG